ncbi:MAG: hypothetical protein II336_18000 [Loktanella sp.]|nr:hypothetical protein [Loktanella sp.]
MLLDITGMKFGRLTVVEKAKRPAHVKSQMAYWRCVCECGGEAIHTKGNLAKGSVKSCGCLRREVAGREPIHGLWEALSYRKWVAMISRCYHPSQQSYPIYGGRGISVCEEWRNDPAAFDAWATANGLSEGLHLDRIDTDGDYSPENCRFVTPKQNANNRRSNRIVMVQGSEMTLAAAAARFGVKASVAAKRIKRGWTEEEAFEVSK